MLTALEQGVKGDKWFSLIDKVASMPNLHAAFQKVRRNGGAPGVDRVTIEGFEERLEENLSKLTEGLMSGSYRPQAVRRTWIDKPGSRERRPLGIPTVRDRVVQTALRNVLEPIFEREFEERSYGFRPGRGTKDALRQVDGLLKRGYVHVVDADLRSFYDTIPHERLMERVRERISDGRILSLVEAFLQQEVMEQTSHWTPEEGTPQGAVISPLLSNIYLHPFDRQMVGEGWELVRYADDFVILCRTEAEAQQALERVRKWVEGAGLTLHPEKTKVVDATQQGGFEFLGYCFERGYRWPRKKSLAKFKDTIRNKTKRTRDGSLQAIIVDVNRSLEGWFEYFKHSYKTAFPPLDKWIRMRLRSILRRRNQRKGRGAGLDHFRWPNVYFAERGLFSLVAARARASQSSRR
jgi:RNA-directed DNA polymerase